MNNLITSTPPKSGTADPMRACLRCAKEGRLKKNISLSTKFRALGTDAIEPPYPIWGGSRSQKLQGPTSRWQINLVSPMLKRIRAHGVARAVVWPEPFTGVAPERLQLRRI